MRRARWAVGLIGFLLVLLAVWQVLAARQGLEITVLRSSEPPVTVVRPMTAAGSERPLVLIGHGFAGSSVVMGGFALTLAHAGYDVVLWDFDGHGTNPRPLPGDTRDSLLSNAQEALAEAVRLGVGTGAKVAIVGHSMGSGVALLFGLRLPETAATVAISPVGQRVTPDLPRNLLLMAGSLESSFVRNAQRILVEAGGHGGDVRAGTARELQIIPGVEHVSILFSPAAHAAVREWLDHTFGPQPGASSFTDRRVRWYGVGLVGTFTAALALLPRGKVEPAGRVRQRPVWWRIGALAGGALGSTLLLAAIGKAGLGLSSLLGLLVGGYLTVWFAVAGLFSLFLMWHRPSRPSLPAVGLGLLVFAALWLGVGLVGQLVWQPWLLIPRRLLLWPLGTALLLPWFLAVGEVQREARGGGRVGWWVMQSSVLVGATFLGVRISPGLGFLVLIVPLFPAFLGFHTLVTGRQRGVWAFAVSGAMFTAWLLLAVFPLQ